MLAVAHRSNAQVVIARPRASEDISTAGTDGGSRDDVPPIVLARVGAAPAHVGGKSKCRHTEFPTVAPLNKAGVGKQNRRMRRRKRMAVAAVGTSLFDGIFQQICCAESRCRSKCGLLQPGPISFD